MRFPVISFNSGELSPQIDARSDVNKYASGCRVLENMIPRIYGGAERRPGTKFIAETSGASVLLEFEYSDTIAYIIEATALQFRFYFDGGLLLDGSGSPVTVATPYIAAALQELQNIQSNDVMWLTHIDFAQRKLTRTTATSFSLDTITFTNGPFLPRNDLEVKDGVTMTPSVTTGSGTLTASSATFQAGHLGALFKLTQPRVNTVTKGSAKATGVIGTAIDVEGPAHFNTHGIWTATVELQRNEDGTNWETFRAYPGEKDRNVQIAFNEPTEGVQYRINVTSYTSGKIKADITVDTPTQDGIVRIDSFTNNTLVNMTVLAELASTDATIRWHEGSWSDVNGYPATATFFEQRIVYAGTPKQPQTVWFSATGDFENFKTPVILTDKSSFSLTADSEKRNSIRWISSLEALIFGTVGGEWRIRSSSLDQPVTPTNFSMKQQSSYGGAKIQPLQVGTAVLFADFVKRKLREITWSEEDAKYVAPDLSALAEHITKSGLTTMAFQRHPDQIVWSTRADGVLLSTTYERDQDVVAWSRHPLKAGLASQALPTSGTPAISETYTFTWISEFSNIYGVPLRNNSILRLDHSGVAVNIGSGIVSIPFSNNPFVEDDVVLIKGTTNYEGSHTLTSGTSSNQIQFSDTFIAETFDGTETVIKQITGLVGGSGRMAQDSSGNLYYAHDLATSGGNGYYITKIATDGTITFDFQFLNTSWTTGISSTCYGVKVDDSFIYMWIVTTSGPTPGGFAFKFDLTTGDQVWAGAAQSFPGYDIDIDSSGNMYAALASGGELRKFDAVTGFVTIFTSNFAIYEVVVDETLGVVVGGGFENGLTSDLFNLYVSNLSDGTLRAKIAVGTVFNAPPWTTRVIGNSAILTDGEFIYVLVADPTIKIFKYDADLNLQKSAAGPTNGSGMFFDIYGNIIVVNQDNGAPANDVFYTFDTDLNQLGFTSNVFPIMTFWDSPAGNAWIKGDGVFNGALASPAVPATSGTVGDTVDTIVNSVAVIPGATEDEVWISTTRTIGTLERHFIEQMQPRDWGDDDEDAWFLDAALKYEGPAVTILTGLGHLEGEEVAVYGNGAIFANQTVIGAEITLSESVTKAIVGLSNRFKLKPMRADANIQNTKGTIKKIYEIVISFFKAGQVEYGTDTDDLKIIDWRTDENYDNPPAIFTGDKVVTFDGGFDVEDNVLITGDSPLPCTVRAIVLRLEVTGR